jgi:transposase-like protein
MSSKKDPTTNPDKPPKRKRAPSSPHSAAEKAQAVLAIWTERVKPAEVMRALGVPYLTLQQWQERAMEGMLQALEPRTNLADGAALSPRLQALLQKRQMATGQEKLQARLQRLQEIAPEPVTGSNP